MFLCWDNACIPFASHQYPIMPQTSIRLSDELWAALNEASSVTGKSRTALIQQAIEQFLGMATALPQDAAIADILARLDRLEALVSASREHPVSIPAASRPKPKRIPSAKQTQPGSIPAASQAMTQADVLCAIGLARSTARDRATRAGLSLDEWIEREYPYRRSGGGWVAKGT